MNFLGDIRKVGTTAFQRPGLARAWGDGGEDQREHVIVTQESDNGLILCRCGGVVTTGDQYTTLPQAWDVHRGLEPSPTPVYKTEDLATDDEVRAFLRGLEDPTTSRPQPGGMGVTRATIDIEDIDEMLQRLKDMQAACTCTPGSDILLCPNYVEGDEDE